MEVHRDLIVWRGQRPLSLGHSTDGSDRASGSGHSLLTGSTLASAVTVRDRMRGRDGSRGEPNKTMGVIAPPVAATLS